MRAERAKIFAPFSPLRGLDAAYREKERTVVPRAQLMCDRQEEIDLKLRQLGTGDAVKITYYSDGDYRTKTCRVTDVLPNKKMICTGGYCISFFDIYDIEILQNGHEKNSKK